MACCCGSGRGQQDHSSRVRRYYQRREEAAEQQGTAAAAAAGCSSSSRVQQQQACVVGREGDELTDDEDDVFHTPPSSPRAANHGDRWRGGAAACAPSRSQEEDALLPALKKALLHNSFGGRALREMATVYGGEEWLLLRYLRAAGGRRHPPEVQVRKARELYERTVLWRAEHVAAAVPPTHRHLGDAGSTVEPSASELNVAARALLAHELKKWSPFRVEALVEAGVVLLSGNVDLVDVAPLRHAGFSKNRQFFVLVMEYVQLLQRGITAQLGRQHTTGPPHRCIGDVIVMDLAKLGWRHIDPRLMHRVAVPLLKTWQAHYPETMHKAYILNAPRIFALIWKIIRPVLAERVVARIVIATDSREEELRALLRYGPNEELPWTLPSAAQPQRLPEMLAPVAS